MDSSLTKNQPLSAEELTQYRDLVKYGSAIGIGGSSLASLLDEVDRARAALTAAEDANGQLEAKIADLTRELSIANEDIERLTKDNDDWDQAFAKLREDKETLEALVKELENEKAAAWKAGYKHGAWASEPPGDSRRNEIIEKICAWQSKEGTAVSILIFHADEIIAALAAQPQPAPARWQPEYQQAMVYAVRTVLEAMPYEWKTWDAVRVLREYLSDARQHIPTLAKSAPASEDARDAARYQWLRKFIEGQITIKGTTLGPPPALLSLWAECDAEALDIQIDAALAQITKESSNG